MRVSVLSVKNKNFKCKKHCLRLSVLLSIFRKEETVAVVVCCLVELYNTAIMTLLLTKTDVTPALLSHECATLSRDKVAESQTLLLSSCTLQLCRINKHGFCTTFPVSQAQFQNYEFVPYLIFS